ncbi:MAG: hypothetical protein ACR2JV_05180 [Gaiellales bacterium]
MIEFKTKVTITKGNTPALAFGGGKLDGSGFSSWGVNIDDAMQQIGSQISTIAGFETYDYHVTDGNTEYIVTATATFNDTLNEAQMYTWLYWTTDTGMLYVSFFTKQYQFAGSGVWLLMKELKTLALSLIGNDNTPLFKHVRVWNNQLELERTDPNNQLSYPKPALFIELANTSDIQQMGAGAQIYNELRVRFHIIHEHYNEYTDGNIFDEDVKVFEIAQRLFYAVSKYEPNGAVAMVRVNEELDFNHDNLYHFVQEYATNLVDLSREEPLNFVPAPTPLAIDLSLNINPTFIHYT